MVLVSFHIFRIVAFLVASINVDGKHEFQQLLSINRILLDRPEFPHAEKSWDIIDFILTISHMMKNNEFIPNKAMLGEETCRRE